MSRALDETPVASPCVSVCVIDEPSGLCAGCYRTLAEIAGWIDLTTAARRAIVRALASRRALYGAAIESRLVDASERHGQR